MKCVTSGHLGVMREVLRVPFMDFASRVAPTAASGRINSKEESQPQLTRPRARGSGDPAQREKRSAFFYDERAQSAAGEREALERYIASRKLLPHFSNARSIRNAMDRARLRQASRVCGQQARAGSPLSDESADTFDRFDHKRLFDGNAAVRRLMPLLFSCFDSDGIQILCRVGAPAEFL